MNLRNYKNCGNLGNYGNPETMEPRESMYVGSPSVLKFRQEQPYFVLPLSSLDDIHLVAL